MSVKKLLPFFDWGIPNGAESGGTGVTFSDNGKEFEERVKMARRLKVDDFFAQFPPASEFQMTNCTSVYYI